SCRETSASGNWLASCTLPCSIFCRSTPSSCVPVYQAPAVPATAVAINAVIAIPALPMMLPYLMWILTVGSVISRQFDTAAYKNHQRGIVMSSSAVSQHSLPEVSKEKHALPDCRYPALGVLVQPDRRVPRRSGGQLLCRPHAHPARLPAVPAAAATGPCAAQCYPRAADHRRSAVRGNLYMPLPVLRVTDGTGSSAVYHLHPALYRPAGQRPAPTLQHRPGRRHPGCGA